MDLWNRLFETSALKGVSVLHESTVGAGLPVVNTVRDLVLTGDDILQIEGIMSGTLSFIFNSFSTPKLNDLKFSDIVMEAKEKGYTEPDPRDDLNGMDVARKVLILARLSGLKLEMPMVKVENIVPPSLLQLQSAQEFMQRLPEFNSYFDELKKSAHEQGCVLRYVGVSGPQGCRVELKKYPFDHPFAALKGSDNIFAFKTTRFPSPLIIQGSGAGSKVTAFGIFSDLLKLTRR
jgi:homoserine dehydrogenase